MDRSEQIPLRHHSVATFGTAPVQIVSIHHAQISGRIGMTRQISQETPQLNRISRSSDVCSHLFISLQEVLNTSFI